MGIKIDEMIKTIREEDISPNKLGDILLANNFQVSDINSVEVIIKPGRKENKDNLIQKIRNVLLEKLETAYPLNTYIKIFKGNNAVNVRIKRIERNSR